MKDRNKECPVCGKSHRSREVASKCVSKVRILKEQIVSADTDGPWADEILWQWDKINRYLEYMKW
jgi:hypothetical protein